MFAGLVAGITALAFSSCAYDPYYSGASYSSGGSYGDGYGYGSSGFSTSFFVSTGNPRWGYDPYAGAYYDYGRRCYYDPYLSGYYPVGYRPRYVYGSPHPHGWSRGRGSIAPPSRIRSYNLTNYRNRTSRYQSLGRDWSRNVRTAPAGRDQRPDRFRDQRPDFTTRGSSQGGNFGGGRDRGGFSPDSNRDRGGRFGNSGSGGFNRGGSNADGNRGGRGGRSGFSGMPNTSVTIPQAPSNGRGGERFGSRESFRPDRGDRGQRQITPQMRPQPSQAPQGDGGGRRGGFRGGNGGASPAGDDGGGRRERGGRGGLRGLGEG